MTLEKAITNNVSKFKRIITNNLFFLYLLNYRRKKIIQYLQNYPQIYEINLRVKPLACNQKQTRNVLYKYRCILKKFLKFTILTVEPATSLKIDCETDVSLRTPIS